MLNKLVLEKQYKKTYLVSLKILATTLFHIKPSFEVKVFLNYFIYP